MNRIAVNNVENKYKMNFVSRQLFYIVPVAIQDAQGHVHNLTFSLIQVFNSAHPSSGEG